MRGLTLCSLALLCCHPDPASAPVAPPARDGAPETPATPAPAAATAPADPPATAAASDRAPATSPVSEPAWALTSSAILLQYETQPTFAVGAATDPFSPYGRVARFTMFRDGTILASKEDARGLFVWQIAPERAAAHLARVHELGFPKLRSHTSDCIGPPARRRCVADASFQVLRAHVREGLREIKNYAGWEPRHPKELQAIYELVTELRAFDPAARLYVPHAATLFVRAPRGPSRADDAARARALPWPLPGDLLGPPGAQELQVSVLDVPQIQAMTAAAGTNHVDGLWFTHGDRLVQASMIPWLPGEDHRPAIASRAKTP